MRLKDGNHEPIATMSFMAEHLKSGVPNPFQNNILCLLNMLWIPFWNYLPPNAETRQLSLLLSFFKKIECTVQKNIVLITEGKYKSAAQTLPCCHSQL